MASNSKLKTNKTENTERLKIKVIVEFADLCKPVLSKIKTTNG